MIFPKRVYAIKFIINSVLIHIIYGQEKRGAVNIEDKTIRNTKNTLNISFHNPNSSDEIANFLIRVIAESISESAINKEMLRLGKSGHLFEDCSCGSETTQCVAPLNR